MDPIAVTLSPGVGHVFGSDKGLAWQFFNCGPGRVLVDESLLAKGYIMVVFGSGPITLVCADDEKAVVMVHPGAL
jgi:hypothetical protein